MFFTMKFFDFDTIFIKHLLTYVFLKGGLGVIWSFAWVCTIYDTPALHPGLHRLETDLFLREGANVSRGSQSVVRREGLAIDTIGSLKVIYTRINSKQEVLQFFKGSKNSLVKDFEIASSLGYHSWKFLPQLDILHDDYPGASVFQGRFQEGYCYSKLGFVLISGENIKFSLYFFFSIKLA